MKKKNIVNLKRLFVIGGLLTAVIFVLTGCGKKENDSKKVNENVEKQVVNSENKVEANVEKQEDKKNTSKTNNKESENKTESSSKKSSSKISSELVVAREGSNETVPSKEYNSTLGYTIRYSTEDFNASFHDNCDWFDRDGDTNGVAVEKENVEYSKKIAKVSNYKKTTINGYDAVYITKRAEGQLETIYYVNAGKDCTYVITKSCQESTEYLEGLGHIMDAMIQTFYVK